MNRKRSEKERFQTETHERLRGALLLMFRNTKGPPNRSKGGQAKLRGICDAYGLLNVG